MGNMEDRELKRNYLWPIIIQQTSPSNCLRQFEGSKVGSTRLRRRKFRLKRMGDFSQ